MPHETRFHHSFTSSSSTLSTLFLKRTRTKITAHTAPTTEQCMASQSHHCKLLHAVVTPPTWSGLTRLQRKLIPSQRSQTSAGQVADVVYGEWLISTMLRIHAMAHGMQCFLSAFSLPSTQITTTLHNSSQSADSFGSIHRSSTSTKSLFAIRYMSPVRMSVGKYGDTIARTFGFCVTLATTANAP